MSLSSVHKDISAACAQAGRVESGITLVAVSKGQPAGKIGKAMGSGQHVFGENRVREIESKWKDLRRAETELHFIGHIQTNKAGDVVRLCDVIHTVDSARLAAALSSEMKKQGRALPCFLQVNTGAEPQKGGVLPQDLPALHDFCVKEAGLDVRGLMCIPPEGEVPDVHFALLQKLARQRELPLLSMGMSGDFARAIAFGATHIRVGTAIFGARDDG